MRFVDRNAVPAPAFLMGTQVARMRDEYLKFLSLDRKQRAQTRPPDRHLPTDPSLDDALTRLFHGKCAFCEGRRSLVPYRFRPTSEALPLESEDPEAHLAYGWLADVWQNLYPVCMECRPRVANAFPVEGPRLAVPSLAEYSRFLSTGSPDWPFALTEDQLLLDPCEDRDIGAHIEPTDSGEILPRSERGRFTIEHFRLNRKELVAQRAAAFSAYLSSRGQLESANADFATLEYGGLIELLISAQASAGAEAAPEPQSSAARAKKSAARKRPATKPARRSSAKKAPAARSTDWRLSRIEIRNFKSLEALDIPMPKPARGPSGDVPLAPALLILGENASGKSSILEAVSLALIGDKARKNLKESAGKLLLNPRFMGNMDMAARNQGSVTLTFVDPDGEEHVRLLGLTPDGFHTDGADIDGLPVFAYGAFRHYRDDFRRWSPERGVISLFRSDNLLSKPDKWLLTLDENRFDTVVGVLRQVFGSASSFRIIERDFENEQCLVVADQGDGIVTRTPLYSVSSGFRTILALACDVMRWLYDKRFNWDFPTLKMATGIVMIDEIEAHLHPRWKIQVMSGLRRALPNITFIVTTHDPLCLRGMRDGEVMVLQRVSGQDAGSELPVMVESLSEVPNVSQLTIEQLLTSDLFDLFNTDDPKIGNAMAELADALVQARGDKPLSEEAARTVARFRKEIEEALPVGRTEVSRLVQEAVAEYVIERGRLREASRKRLRDKTRQRIVQLLEQP